MTKKSMPFDGTPVTNAADWSAMARHFLADGVLTDMYNKLAIYADSTGMQIKIPSGAAWVKGHYYQNDAQEVMAISAAHATLARFDRVVLRVDWTNGLINTAILTGTPGASPTEPALTQSSTIWEFPLAKVAVGAAVTTITAGNITDERAFASNAAPDLPQINTNASTLTAGMVVVIDGANDNSFTLTSKATPGDPSICGILTENVVNLGSTHPVKKGLYPVLTWGPVPRKNWLIAAGSDHPGYLVDSGSTQRPAVGGAGIARSGTAASGAGTVNCDVDIVEYSATATLQLLAQVYSALCTNNGPVSHSVPTGTDGLIVIVPGYASSGQGSPTAASWQATGQTAQGMNPITTGANYYNIQISVFTLHNPTPGAGAVSFSGAAAAAYYRPVCINCIGSQTTLTRPIGALDQTIGITDTATANSVLLDLMLDIYAVIAGSGNTWTPGAGVTPVYSTAGEANLNCAIFVGVKAGAAGSTSLQETSTANARLEHLVIPVAGS